LVNGRIGAGERIRGSGTGRECLGSDPPTRIWVPVGKIFEILIIANIWDVLRLGLHWALGIGTAPTNEPAKDFFLTENITEC
jgi:hypothetical protein